MDTRLIFMFFLFSISAISAQHENIPYQDVEKICESCTCLTAQETDKRYHHAINCASRKFKHILARWPDEFGKNHNGAEITAEFSNNHIEILQQIPATNATLTFSCRNCGIKELQAPTFMDAPNIKRLDLSWNAITTDELIGEVFRGPYRSTYGKLVGHYEPIGLQELDLSHNQLYTLDRKVFEHTPNLRRLVLTYNKLRTLDKQFAEALVTVPNLEDLDLSYTGISALDPKIFTALKKLRRLNLAGNHFTKPPVELKLLGHTLETLNMAENPIKQLDEDIFSSLKALKRLNMSYTQLSKISNKTFVQSTSLEFVYLTNNQAMEQLDLDGFTNCKNLTQLDISFGSLTTLKLSPNDSLSNNTALTRPWPKLRSFEFAGNPWLCDCDLLTALEYMSGRVILQQQLHDARCDTPYIFAGAQISNITAANICSLIIPKKYRVVDEDPPRFLRKKYIILTLITASVVIVLGLIIGFIVSCIRRRLKRQDFGVEPIRYTSVRCSNLSAFSNVNQNSKNSRISA